MKNLYYSIDHGLYSTYHKAYSPDCEGFESREPSSPYSQENSSLWGIFLESIGYKGLGMYRLYAQYKRVMYSLTHDDRYSLATPQEYAEYKRASGWVDSPTQEIDDRQDEILDNL